MFIKFNYNTLGQSYVISANQELQTFIGDLLHSALVIKNAD